MCNAGRAHKSLAPARPHHECTHSPQPPPMVCKADKNHGGAPQDLERLIGLMVDPQAADYAVITGVQIHNWAASMRPGGPPNLELVEPHMLYAVVNGERRELRLDTVPSLTKRQLSHLSHNAAPSGLRVGRGRRTVITETPVEECFKRTMRQPADERLRAMPVPAASPPPQETPPKEPAACRWPSWQTYVSVTGPERVMPLERDVRAPTMDEGDE
uniref:Uncharacterized protein n=1 Tax=Chlamydomonas euryale TaxID=1486919 RepID=A0A7R9YSE2_9CHLO|mmetsp:Transcript_16760/g.50228  ORF Transcript_16760/g.50228 Transcript_16760/m.50228 type:complete len:215 (+) Transcript_16760:56-700(+)